jgi:ketosteroid isomerase-like protein
VSRRRWIATAIPQSNTSSQRDTARAMSQKNVEIVRRSIEAWNRRDLTAWTASLHPDAEIDWSRSRAPFKGVYRGPDGIETFWASSVDV